MKNVFYFHTISPIGGIEQFFAYLAEKYRDWDITIFYKFGDPAQVHRIQRYVRCVKYTNQTIECDTVFFCFNREIMDKVHAKKKYLVLHGDYLTMVKQGQLSEQFLPRDDRVDGYYGVSQVVCDAWKELTGLDCKLVYNPFIQKPKKKLLKLVYCGRLSSEKGGDLVNKFLAKLNEHKVDYLLYVYSNKRMFGDEHIVYLDTRIDAGQFLTKDNFDFIIISSKNEGYCYSLIQALANGLPAIVTPCPVFKELGCNDKNSICIDFDGENIDSIIPLLNNDYSFTYTPKEDTWDKILVPGKSTYRSEDSVLLRCTKAYFDMTLNKAMQIDDVFDTTPERAKLLLTSGVVAIQEGDLT